jgi:aryl-alcohol dehydrogenase-like predicted oxidoreductase
MMSSDSWHPLSERRSLGWTDLKVCALALGTMQFGWSVTDVGAFDLLDRFAEAGGNFIDTADMYGPDQTRRSWQMARPHVGMSEDVIGRWMAERRNRDAMVVATKVRARMWDGDDGEGLSRRHIIRAVEDSLRRLRTDRIDLYQAHWPDDDTPLEESFAAFAELVDSGKIRYVGTSNYGLAGQLGTAAALWRTRDVPRLACEQPRYSLVHRDEYETQVKGIAVEHNLGVICYSPLAGGFLTDKYHSADEIARSHRGRHLLQYGVSDGWRLLEAVREIARNHATSPGAVALSWILAQPTVTAPIVGANSIGQLESWLPAATLELEAGELLLLDERSWSTSQIEFSSW